MDNKNGLTFWGFIIKKLYLYKVLLKGVNTSHLFQKSIFIL